MTKDFGVPVRTMLPASTFRRLERVARAHDTSVGALVAECVRRALTVAAGPQGPHPDSRAAQRAREAHERRLAREKAAQARAAEAAAARAQVKAERDRAEAAYAQRYAEEVARRRRLTDTAREVENAQLRTRIRQLHAEKLSDSQIAKQLYLAQPTVSLWRRGMNLPTLFVSPNQKGGA